ncbi:HU family DNA-binding protein, partial [Paenibacillus elgii]|uniref:HU family DNA-binding protein n=1 Tax=Paenibacillus elgii TaxID=189691 RepID=UPI002041692C
IKWQGFGNFEVRERAARDGVNPKLLAELKKQGVDEETARKQAYVPIAETRVPAFKASDKFKEALK